MNNPSRMIGGWPHAPPRLVSSFNSTLLLSSIQCFNGMVRIPYKEHNTLTNHIIMPSKYHFKKVTNADIQKIFKVNAKQATYMLNKIRDAVGKTSDEYVRMFELCSHQKLDINDVCLILELKE